MFVWKSGGALRQAYCHRSKEMPGEEVHMSTLILGVLACLMHVHSLD